MFNIKEFLIENRITTVSRIDEAQWGFNQSMSNEKEALLQWGKPLGVTSLSRKAASGRALEVNKTGKTIEYIGGSPPYWNVSPGHHEFPVISKSAYNKKVKVTISDVKAAYQKAIKSILG